tara:strand:+ start:648 stop:1628 length:981 start_codon:yes stop_codon:yes gene_type:complete
MKALEQLILSKSRPVQKEAKHIGVSELDKLIMEVAVSGQQSERNLVTGINACASPDNPVKMRLGELGEHLVTGARQLGGGKPEPKADIEILTTKDPIGISMKKENFAFLENWMDEKKLFLRLRQVGMDDDEAKVVVEELKDKIKEITQIMKPVIIAEKNMFLSIVKAVAPSYQFPDDIKKNEEVIGALINSPAFGKNGKFKNSFKIQNIYARLSDLFQEKYSTLLKIIIGGGSENPHPAEGVLVADIEANMEDCSRLQGVLNKIKSVDSVVEYYKNDPKINIRFRMRPMTLVRTAYSRTNRGKYKVGQRLYSDDQLGISWTVAVTK